MLKTKFCWLEKQFDALWSILIDSKRILEIFQNFWIRNRVFNKKFQGFWMSCFISEIPWDSFRKQNPNEIEKQRLWLVNFWKLRKLEWRIIQWQTILSEVIILKGKDFSKNNSWYLEEKSRFQGAVWKRDDWRLSWSLLHLPGKII